MNKSQKLEYQHKIENYFEHNKAYDIFEDLIKDLLREKPDDPISFMLSKLRAPKSKQFV